MALHVRALTDEERTKLERLTHAQTAPVRLVRRAQIIAVAATGLSVPAIAAQVKRSEKCVRQWLEQFNQAGLAGLDDAPRTGRPAHRTPRAPDARVPITRTRTVG